VDTKNYSVMTGESVSMLHMMMSLHDRV